jgi:hypothetical protein
VKRGNALAFWGTVAAVSILANFGLELLSAKVPALGLQRFVAFTHLGAAPASAPHQ